MSTWVDPPSAVCEPWDISLDCCPAAARADEDQQAESILWASNELWWVTGQRIGLCSATVHVCPRRCWDMSWDWSMWCDDCPPYDVIDLGPQLVTEVTSVTSNGTVLDKDDDWIVLDWRWLARVSGSWADSGVVVAYVYGEPPNASALRAAETLACEDLKRKAGDKSCRLSRERSSRRDGRYEIPEVDAWVSLQNREDDCGLMAPEKVQGFYRVTSGS